jgi:D-alanine--poly(phosphoribitol) ligase subunit 2
MADNVKEYILKRVQKRSKLPKDCDISTFDYIASGYVDSMGLILFIVDIEAKFDIEILDTDIESPDFRTIGGLISIVMQKKDAK